MGYQSDLDNLRSQSGSGMGDIRDSYDRSKDQYYTNSGNPMGYLDTNYQQADLGRYVPPMITGGPGATTAGMAMVSDKELLEPITTTFPRPLVATVMGAMGIMGIPRVLHLPCLNSNNRCLWALLNR